jgi:hypothetical protein
MGIKGGEVQAKSIGNIFNKIAENFLNLRRWSSSYRKLLEHQTDKTRKEPLHS